MKIKLLLSLSMLVITLHSCSKEDPDISGEYRVSALIEVCPDESIDLVEGMNTTNQGIEAILSGNALFTVGGKYTIDYLIDLPTLSTQVEKMFEGDYNTANNTLTMCGDGVCIDEALDSEETNTIIGSFSEGECQYKFTFTKK